MHFMQKMNRVNIIIRRPGSITIICDSESTFIEQTVLKLNYTGCEMDSLYE